MGLELRANQAAAELTRLGPGLLFLPSVVETQQGTASAAAKKQNYIRLVTGHSPELCDPVWRTQAL